MKVEEATADEAVPCEMIGPVHMLTQLLPSAVITYRRVYGCLARSFKPRISAASAQIREVQRNEQVADADMEQKALKSDSAEDAIVCASPKFGENITSASVVHTVRQRQTILEILQLAVETQDGIVGHVVLIGKEEVEYPADDTAHIHSNMEDKSEVKVDSIRVCRGRRQTCWRRCIAKRIVNRGCLAYDEAEEAIFKVEMHPDGAAHDCCSTFVCAHLRSRAEPV